MHWNDHTEKVILDRINKRPRHTALERWKRSRFYDTLSLAVVTMFVVLIVFSAWVWKLL